jgi:hypothetical protein
LTSADRQLKFSFLLATVEGPILGLSFSPLKANPCSYRILDADSLEPLVGSSLVQRIAFTLSLSWIAPPVRSLLAEFPSIVKRLLRRLSQQKFVGETPGDIC